MHAVDLLQLKQATAHGLEARVGAAQQAARARASGHARPGRSRKLLCATAPLWVVRGAQQPFAPLSLQPAALRLRYLLLLLVLCCSSCYKDYQGDYYVSQLLVALAGDYPHSMLRATGSYAACSRRGTLLVPLLHQQSRSQGEGIEKCGEAFFAVFSSPAMAGMRGSMG